MPKMGRISPIWVLSPPVGRAVKFSVKRLFFIDGNPPRPCGAPLQGGECLRSDEPLPLLGGVARGASRGGFNPVWKNLTALPGKGGALIYPLT